MENEGIISQAWSLKLSKISKTYYSLNTARWSEHC